MSKIHSTVFGSDRVNEKTSDTLPMTSKSINSGIVFCIRMPPFAMRSVYVKYYNRFMNAVGTRLLRLCVFATFYELLQGFMLICNGLCVDNDIYASIATFMRESNVLCAQSAIYANEHRFD